MSLELCILASGSSGNCAIVRSAAGILLIDVGIGPRTTAARMLASGVAIPQVAAICLTHLDRDHFNLNWTRTIIARGITVYCHQARVEDVLRYAMDAGHDADALRPLLRPFNGQPFEALPGLKLVPLRLAHDQEGTHGFVLNGSGARIGYATDLGRVPRQLIESFEDLDILALESNYDPQMQISSSRPWFLKRRIMGGSGHLSNVEAFAAV